MRYHEQRRCISLWRAPCWPCSLISITYPTAEYRNREEQGTFCPAFLPCFCLCEVHFDAAKGKLKGKCPGKQKKKPRNRSSEVLAAGEGFEPSHTESESAVLPLHKPARFFLFCLPQRTDIIIQKNEEMSIVYFEKINYFLRKGIKLHGCTKKTVFWWF